MLYTKFNMPDFSLSSLSWKDADLDNSLRQLHEYVENEASRQIDWYYHKKIWKTRMSSTLRCVAIVLFVLGGLVPIVKATLPPKAVTDMPFDFGQAGYLLIGVAAGCMGLDRFFGFSSGWIRYMTTALALEKSREEFRLTWTGQMSKLRGNPPDQDQIAQLILTCTAFSLAIKSQVEQETKAWVTEFQSNLAQLQKDLQAKADETKDKSRAASAG
jgi:hypothetical protein